jgi:transmembrane sensor
MNHSSKQQDDRSYDAGLHWIVRLRSDTVSAQDMQEFALWLAQDNSHKIAMDSMLDMWDDLGSVKQLPFSPQLTRPAANQRNWLAASVAVAACLVLAVFLWPQSEQHSKEFELQTALGERNRFELIDHSTLTLNTNSKVTVNYNTALRHIELVRGEAYFEVSPDADRPFEVDTGSVKVTALGTAFNIYRNDDVASITVIEGVVRVTELGVAGSRPGATEILHANQHLRAGPKGLQPASTVDVEHFTAWQEGKLIAREMPLPELIAQMERHRNIRILISDADVASLTISGVFELDQPEAILRALELSLDLQVVELDANTLQLLKTSH